MIRNPKRYRSRLVFPWDFHSEWAQTNPLIWHKRNSSSVIIVRLERTQIHNDRETSERWNVFVTRRFAHIQRHEGETIMQTHYWI